MRVAFAVSAVLIATTSANAQTTWHNLSFGMTVGDAAKALDGYVLQPGEASKSYSKYVLSPVFDLYGADAAVHFPLEVSLLFARETGGLEEVALHFVVRAAERVAADASAFATLVVASERMVSDLKAKYGMPEEQHGACPFAARDLLGMRGFAECKATWRQSGQVIDLNLAVFNDRGVLEVYYFLNYDRPKTQL